MMPAEYARFANGTVHLTDQAALLEMGSMFGSPMTLCGRPMSNDTENGDETLSGVAATCKTCKRILKGRNQ